jgi:gamma-glutamyltranspeptidase/glutathione hydrolase
MLAERAALTGLFIALLSRQIRESKKWKPFDSAISMNVYQVENNFRATRDRKCAHARAGMVSAAFAQAAQAGALMLQKGGNAVDAAAAAALCLCVCEPQACGLGGQSMALIHLNGRTFFLDGSGRVPARARLNEFTEDDFKFGYKATSVPTTTAVLGYMVHRYGSIPWREIVEPAMIVASEGYHITELQHRLQVRELSNFGKVTTRSGARYFLKDGVKPYEPGERFMQPELARLLKTLMEQGPEAFYQGAVARQIDADMRTHGGFLRAGDLADIPWPLERPALHASYRGLDLISAPPPAAGRSLFILLKHLESKPSDYWRHGNPQAVWDLAKAISQVLKERMANPIDPDLYQTSHDAVFDNPAEIKGVSGMHKASGDCNGETTHLSTMDAMGNAVGLTQSVNLVYASKAAAQNLGFLYNNYLLDCNTVNPGHPHFLKPGGRPASFVAPVMAIREKRPWLVVGSPGSERILSSVAQFLSHVVDGSLPICEAMRRPRLHNSTEGALSIESGRFAQHILSYLEKKSIDLCHRSDYSFYLGAIHAVLQCVTKDEFQGVAEIRRDGISTGIMRRHLKL